MPARERTMQDVTSSSGILDLTGHWRVVHEVETSDRPGFVGLRIEFQLSLVQDGKLLTGDGEKFLVGWELARREEASRLQISGHADSAEVRLFLREVTPTSPERPIIGEIVWRPVDEDHMLGRFKVDLAATGGRSEAFRRRA
jgi:hypothetical protein